MKKNPYFLNAILTLILFVAALVLVLFRTFLPQIILPAWDVPNFSLLCLLALVIDRYAAPQAKRCKVCIPVFSFLSFALLSWAAGLASPVDALTLGLVGSALFTVLTWIFTSLCQRIASGPVAKAAPIISAVGLYLAVQCFMGIGF